MSYIGAQPTSAAFITDQFSGTGAQTAFTMSVAPATTSSMLVSISGVLQDPSTYAINATTLTFSSAPPTGTGNISVRYLGVPVSGVTTTAYRTVTEFTATSNQTTFNPPSYTVGYINVYRNGVRLGSTDFTASNGTSVVLVNGAAAGDLITTESFYVSSVLNAIPAVAGAVTAAYLDNSSYTGTGSMIVPTGTTAQRPSSTAVGQQRLNSSLKCVEYYNGTSWFQVGSQYAVTYLLIGGGGSGGNNGAGAGSPGGGGAGGMLSGSVNLTSGLSYSIVVGAGGAGQPGTGTGYNGVTGSNSTFSALAQVAYGGGYGAGSGSRTGGAGGSGGGGNNGLAGGVAFAGQGYAGSVGDYGGGGGAGGTTGGPTGGPGAPSSITGSFTYYAGGGAGEIGSTNSYSGGIGGGGASSATNGVSGTSGTANTGGGGGSYVGAVGGSSGSGGSGVCIISYASPTQIGSGGTVTSHTFGGVTYWVHTFTSSGTYVA